MCCFISSYIIKQTINRTVSQSVNHHYHHYRPTMLSRSSLSSFSMGSQLKWLLDKFRIRSVYFDKNPNDIFSHFQNMHVVCMCACVWVFASSLLARLSNFESIFRNIDREDGGFCKFIPIIIDQITTSYNNSKKYIIISYKYIASQQKQQQKQQLLSFK